MRKFVTLAFIGVFAVSVASCGNSHGSNSASSLEVDSLVGPSALDARKPSGGGGGKGGGGGTTSGGGGSISLVVLTPDNGTPGLSFLDRVTFSVSTPATTKPWVTLKCYQNGVIVSQESNAMFDGSLDQIFVLGPTAIWSSGGANCTATLENWDNYTKGSITVLTSMSFTIVG